MRKSFALAAASAVAGLTLLAGAPANAAPAGNASATAADTVPGCVATFFWRPFDSYLSVNMKNTCADVQRVKPTFNSDAVKAPCYVLQPGKDATFKEVAPGPASFYQFRGLVHC
ncbi:hypothetical protein ABZ419_29335 [Streptomyces cinnamoneus]|uniref:hypothetical protein n=1 Tax=Streptomyces cinnamoneus TaxID=53446 RepID=UPI0033F39B87